MSKFATKAELSSFTRDVEQASTNDKCRNAAEPVQTELDAGSAPPFFVLHQPAVYTTYRHFTHGRLRFR